MRIVCGSPGTCSAAVRAAVGPTRVVGLRLSCDELAPWAGITPEQAPGLAAELVAGVDYLVVVRGSIFSVEQTRPDFHEPAGFNLDLAALVAGLVDVPVIAAGVGRRRSAQARCGAARPAAQLSR